LNAEQLNHYSDAIFHNFCRNHSQQSIIFHSRELRLKRHNKSLAVIAASDRNWQIIRFEAKKCST